MPVTPTGNAYVDAILWGGWKWDSPALTYYFSDDFDAWTVEEKTAFRQALRAYAESTNLTFSRVRTEAEANIVVHTASDAEMTALFAAGSDDPVRGVFETPQDASERGVVDGRLYVEGWFNNEQYGAPAFDDVPTPHPEGLAVGGYGFTTYLQELGHALGLSYPHETGGDSPLMPGVNEGRSRNLGVDGINQGVHTVMSDNRGWRTEQNPEGRDRTEIGYSEGPAALDIAALQFLYGAKDTHSDGDDVYVLTGDMGWQTIWDTGGIDEIRYEGSTLCVISLQSAPLDRDLAGVGTKSYLDTIIEYGGYVISADHTDALADVGGETGVIIENATGGRGRDVIYGNDVDNRIDARMGFGDLVYGFGGNDTIKGGGGADRLLGGTGDDTLRGGEWYDTLLGEDGNDEIHGGDGNDHLRGHDGDDTLDGGTGDDTLISGGGADVFLFRPGFDHDLIYRFNPDRDTLAIDEAIWGGGLTAEEVVERFARDTGQNVIFDFETGEKIRLLEIASPDDLVDAIAFL